MGLTDGVKLKIKSCPSQHKIVLKTVLLNGILIDCQAYGSRRRELNALRALPAYPIPEN